MQGRSLGRWLGSRTQKNALEMTCFGNYERRVFKIKSGAICNSDPPLQVLLYHYGNFIV